MNSTQIFEFVMNWINQKIIKFNRVPLGWNRARPRCTVRGAARGHAGHGPRARPTATRGVARAAHGVGTTPVRGKRLRSSGSPARERRTAARRRQARLWSGRRWGRWSGRGGGAVGRRAARKRRQSGATRAWRGREAGGVGEATVVATAAHGERGARSAGARCAVRMRGAWQPRGNGVLPRGPGAARGDWQVGPAVSDFRINKSPERK
jgi:hypothetical protein